MGSAACAGLTNINVADGDAEAKRNGALGLSEAVAGTKPEPFP